MCECPGCYFASVGFEYNLKESCLYLEGDSVLQSLPDTDAYNFAGEEAAGVLQLEVHSPASLFNEDIEEDFPKVTAEPAGFTVVLDKTES